jgi:hypothetical protein
MQQHVRYGDFINENDDTKKLYMEINDYAYVLHVTTHQAMNLKHSSFLHMSEHLKALCSNGQPSKLIVVVAVQKVINKKVTLRTEDDLEAGPITTNSAQQIKARISNQMQSFKEAFQEDAGILLQSASVPARIAYYVQMFARARCADLGVADEIRRTALLPSEKDDEDNVQWLALWNGTKEITQG